MPAAPVEPAKRPPPKSRARITVEGIFWLMAALVFLVQGWLRGVNLVALVACFLVGIWIINFLWVFFRRRLRKLRVRRHVEGPVFAHQPFTAYLEIENPTLRNQSGLRLFDQAVHGRHSWFLPRLAAGSTARQPYAVTLRRRGLFRWPSLVLASGHPFGLARRTLEFPSGEETLVLPSLGRLHRGRLRRLLLYRQPQIISTKRPIRRHASAETEFYGVRDFRSGDSPRWIHWRTTARVGELMVREFEEPPHDNLILIVEPWLPRPAAELEADLESVRLQNRRFIETLLAAGPAPALEKRLAKESALARKELPYRKPLENLELLLSLAATICWEWNRNSGSRFVLLVAGPKPQAESVDTSLTHVWPLLEMLALAEGAPLSDAAALARCLAREPLPPGPVLLLTTHSTGLDRALSAQLRRPVAVVDASQPVVETLFEPARGE